MPRLPAQEKKVKTSLYLDSARWTRLKVLSERTLIPVSALIRRGIDLVCEEYKMKS